MRHYFVKSSEGAWFTVRPTHVRGVSKKTFFFLTNRKTQGVFSLLSKERSEL